MDVKTALKEQYGAGLAMLRQCIERCPDDLWLAGEHPRPYWRIAWHTLYFTHNYLVQTMEDFNASIDEWPEAIRTRLGLAEGQVAIDVEPYEIAAGVEPLSRAKMIEYLDYVRGLMASTVDALDLEREDSGFPWYPDTSKMSHQLLNLRHIQGHVGQLSELLMMRGIDIDWVSRA